MLCIACSQVAHGTGSTRSPAPASPVATSTATAIERALPTPLGVAAIACSDQVIAVAAADELPAAPGHKRAATVNELWVAPLPAEEPLGLRRVAVARHGGNIGLVRIAGNWLVYLEYQQLGANTVTFWELDAIDLMDDTLTAVAYASRPPQTNALPTASVDTQGHVAWAELTSDGQPPQVRIYDLARQRYAVAELPSGAYPAQPLILGQSLLFLDVSSDPNRANEDWLGYGGMLEEMDLSTHRLAVVGNVPDSRFPVRTSSAVAWLASVADPRVPGTGATVFQARLTRLGADTVSLGYAAATLVLTDAWVAWFDLIRSTVAVRSVSGGQTTLISLGAPVQVPWSICNGALVHAGANAGQPTLVFQPL